MRRTRGPLLVVLAMSMFLAITWQEPHRGPTNCSRDPVPCDGVLAYSIAEYSFYTDYGGVWGGKNDNTNNGNANVSESATVWASVLTTPAFSEPRSDGDPIRSSEASVVISTTAGAFDHVGSVGLASTTVVTTVGSPSESTLLHSGRRPDASSQTHQSVRSLVCSASVSGLCPVVGDLNHPRSSSSVTLNHATA